MHRAPETPGGSQREGWPGSLAPRLPSLSFREEQRQSRRTQRRPAHMLTPAVRSRGREVDRLLSADQAALMTSAGPPPFPPVCFPGSGSARSCLWNADSSRRNWGQPSGGSAQKLTLTHPPRQEAQPECLSRGLGTWNSPGRGYRRTDPHDTGSNSSVQARQTMDGLQPRELNIC